MKARHTQRCPKTGRFVKAMPPVRRYSRWSVDAVLDMTIMCIVTCAVITGIIGIATI